MKTKIANSLECTHAFREWLKDNGMYVDFCMNLFHANSMTLSEYVYALWSAPSTFCILDMMVSGAFVFSEASYRSSAVWYAASASWNSYLSINYTISN